MPKVYTTTSKKTPEKGVQEAGEDDLSSSLRQLRTSSEKLNQLTESIAKTVRSVEKYLTEDCHIGIEVSVPVGYVEDDNYRLGYSKLGNSWRIVVTPDDLMSASRPWSDCPRGLKLATAKCLPDLIKELDKAASNYITSANDTLATVDAALKGLVGGGK